MYFPNAYCAQEPHGLPWSMTEKQGREYRWGKMRRGFEFPDYLLVRGIRSSETWRNLEIELLFFQEEPAWLIQMSSCYIPLGRGPGADTGHAGGTVCPSLTSGHPVNELEGHSGLTGKACCHRDTHQEKCIV